MIRIEINRTSLAGTIDFVGSSEEPLTGEEGARVLESRELHPALAPDSRLHEDTRLWAALQNVGGGTWGGCVYEVDEIISRLEASGRASAKNKRDA